MQAFSLSSKKELPTAIEVEGGSFAIRTDFKDILRILRMSQDAEIAERDKYIAQQKMFFKEEIPPNIEEHFNWFLSCGIEPGESGGDNDFDFEQDAMEIYSGFMQIYSIDLLEVDLHWWTFKALLNGVCSATTALANKIGLRHTNDSDSKKKETVNRAYRNVQLKHALSHSEERLQEQINERLKNGESITGLLGGG